MIGSSEKVAAIREYLTQVAGFDSNVLITGETGTGKELAAAMIHENSRRSNRPFITLNCAAIPETLFESEVFGYEKGAFTGATRRQAGVFAEAGGGTVFLDEIGEMPLMAQSKMLRVLENREIRSIGSARSVHVDVRVVAATNQPLEELVGQGKFRSDLFYRLNIGRVHLPPLRERKEDISALIAHFLTVLNAEMGRAVVGLEPVVRDSLMDYTWPGNVRELRNVLEATLLTIQSPMIGFKDLPEQYQTKFYHGHAMPFQERERLVSALVAANWNISKTAQQLDCARMTIYRKMEQFSLERPRPVSILSL